MNSDHADINTVAKLEQGFGITTIDTGYERAGLAASHLLMQGDQAALIDVGASPGIPHLLDVLHSKGFALEQVRWLFVTHVHLDHAGAAGELMQRLPNAQLVVHERGARHMIDPAKLIAGARAVYGAQGMDQRFGAIRPVASDRIVEVRDGLECDLNGRTLVLIDTPGHARHHYCVYDEHSRGFFTGDTFGLSYRELDSTAGPFILPTTTPVQFDPQALKDSIDRLMSYQPQRMFLTHFGCVEQPEDLALRLKKQIDDFVQMGLEHANPGEGRGEALFNAMSRWLEKQLIEQQCDVDFAQALDLLVMDLKLNVQGIECWLDYRAKQNTGNV